MAAMTVVFHPSDTQTSAFAAVKMRRFSFCVCDS
jgi:hypothetical protein